MDKSSLDSYLISQNDSWEYKGYGEECQCYMWLQPKLIESTNGTILMLELSLEDNSKNVISVITADPLIINNIKTQITQYKMKLIKSERIGSGSTLSYDEYYEGKNYEVYSMRARDNMGTLVVKYSLAKK